jgi:glycine betaine/proline transport system substrate-binding protein
MTRLAQLLAGCSLALIGGTQAAFAADMTIGVPNWPSANVTAHILQAALTERLGLDVETQNGTNPVIFEAMDSGSMDVHPEVWLPNQVALHDKYVEERGTVLKSPKHVEAVNAMCVNEIAATEHGVKSIYDLTNPEKAALFDSNGDGKGEVWIGATGFASALTERVRAHSYGYDQTLELQEYDEGLALAGLDAAVRDKKPFIFYCYGPHHVFALHKLVILEEPPHNPETWKVLQPTDGADWIEKSNADSAWGPSTTQIYFTKSLKERLPAAAAMLENVQLDNETVSAWTYALVVEKQDPAEFAKKWVTENAATVDSWMPN